MTQDEMITELASNAVHNNADFIKHLNEGDFSSRVATLIAKSIRGDLLFTSFWQLAKDELEIEMTSYIDEVEAGRRG